MIGPTVNSYKRTGASSTRSGATWSPRTVSFGGNDRTHFLRVPDNQRVELRGADGSANPYLAAAAVLGAGLDGIGRSADPGQVGEVTAGRPMLAADAAARGRGARRPTRSCAARSTSPATGVAAYYADLKRAEFLDWHNQVSAWEVDHYVTAF